jgi:hypothetical protein
VNQREAILILFEATAELPDTKHLRRARRWAQRRMEVLRLRYARLRCSLLLARFQKHLETCIECRGKTQCAIGEPLLQGGLLACCEARGEPAGTWTAEVPDEVRCST